MSVRGQWLVLAVMLTLGGCAAQNTAAPRPGVTTDASNSIRSQLVGTWQYEENGVTLEVVYTPTTVTLSGLAPTPYTLQGNEITIDIVGAKTSIIEFKGKNEMVQTNKTDGQRYVFKRKRTG